jgi:ribosomal-protein-alanine N-acetyltransferase
MDFPELETVRLLLRAITPDDRFAIFENYSDPDVAGWFFDQPYTRIEQADQIIQEFIQKSSEGKGLAWAIVLKASSEFIGTCSYENFVIGQQGEIGFDLAKVHWGHGTMSEALGAIITYGFTVLDLFMIEAHTYSSNIRARRLLEKLGYKVVAVTDDSLCYTLTRKDWIQIRP